MSTEKVSSTGSQNKWSDKPLWKRVKWVEALMLGTTPLVWLYGILYVPLQMKTLIACFIYYQLCMFGSTAGLHRLWSHGSYKATWPYRLFWAVITAGTAQWDIYWWSLMHRAHHRWLDQDNDPYCARKGLFFSHMGWLIFKNDLKDLHKIDMSDLLADPVVVWQRKYYVPLGIFMTFIFPTVLAGFGWNDWVGGFVYLACARLVAVQHTIFCVNSLAHYFGDATYDDTRTPRDNIIMALLTLGEGYHNFHHEFPDDYRATTSYFQYDPSKWMIRFFSFFGVTYDLKRVAINEVHKTELLMKEKVIAERKKTIDWGKPLEELPSWTRDDFELQIQNTPSLMIIDGVVYDVEKFVDKHPGGRGFLKVNFGRDASKSFNGGVYHHSNSARNMMAQFRVALITADDDSGIDMPAKKDV
ncbi:hypothetical protein BKA69DRAFT_1091005 [Paraphysoderma sedebokerense]|nr:hypothetical protein BKA69DRAFT_1091005 [Paraphysoderma sedebokerense]